MPLLYNTCDSLTLTLGKLGSGIVREFSDHIDFYLNNFRTDTTTLVAETIVVKGATSEPSYTLGKGLLANATATQQWDAATSTYTLTIEHMGGVNVTVNCAGNGTDRKVDGPAVTSLPMPLQPAPYNGQIIIEAEDMDYKNIKSCVTGPYYSHPNIRGHSGNGFVEMGTDTGGSLRHQLVLHDGQEGEYTITIRYTSSAKSGSMRAKAGSKNSTIKFEKTAVNEWRKVSFDATLKAGKNTLFLTNIGAVSAYIDQIIYTPVDAEPERYEINVRSANHGSITPEVTEAAEGDTVILDIKADEGYGLKELAVVNGVNFTMGTTISLETLANGNSRLSFVMPDDMVTLKPVFEKGTNVVDGIDIINADGTKISAIYNINGEQRENSASGFSIIRTTGGEAKKVFVK